MGTRSIAQLRKGHTAGMGRRGGQLNDVHLSSPLVGVEAVFDIILPQEESEPDLLSLGLWVGFV